jgi:hypothetical protein
MNKGHGYKKRSLVSLRKNQVTLAGSVGPIFGHYFKSLTPSNVIN